MRLRVSEDAATSYGPSLQLRNSRPERGECALRVLDRLEPFRRDFEITLRTSASLGRRIAVARCDQAVRLEPIERDVERRQQHFSATRRLDLIRDRDAVRVVCNAQDGEKN